MHWKSYRFDDLKFIYVSFTSITMQASVPTICMQVHIYLFCQVQYNLYIRYNKNCTPSPTRTMDSKSGIRLLGHLLLINEHCNIHTRLHYRFDLFYNNHSLHVGYT